MLNDNNKNKNQFKLLIHIYNSNYLILLHYWLGSFCRVLDKHKPLFPRSVIAVSDIITLIADNGNQIPDKSWMLTNTGLNTYCQ
ncbi:MAG: hypothetical protein K0R16_1470 [Nitrososphaeraceae archaeon]|nr:hypothetical protein [Nitrososphaeraceae archaeon]